MSFLKRLFGEAQKKRTMLDDVQEVGGKLIIKCYRNISAQWGCAPTSKTTDQQIMDIYSQVGTAFHEAEEHRGEHIPALYLNYIVLHFLQLYETLGQHFREHLEYEVNKYLAEGLREDYKRELRLIDENSSDPDVIHLKKLQAATKERLLSTSSVTKEASTLQPLNLIKDAQDTVNAAVGTVQQIAVEIMAISAETVGKAVEAVQGCGIQTIHFDEIALCNEVSAYHIYIAIEGIMSRAGRHGNEAYYDTEKLICSILSTLVLDMKARQLDSPQFCEITSSGVLNLARAYFRNDMSALGISKQDVMRYGGAHDCNVLKLPFHSDEMIPVLYTIRVGLLLHLEMYTCVEDSSLAVVFLKPVLSNYAHAMRSTIRKLTAYTKLFSA